MSTNKERLPRKVKKQLKKDKEAWNEYLLEKKKAKERHENLDIIFTRNYKNSTRIFRKMIRGR